jgi:hypothetical protein
MFHLHEEKPSAGKFTPASAKGVTNTIGLMVADVDSVMANAVAAGARSKLDNRCLGTGQSPQPTPRITI